MTASIASASSTASARLSVRMGLHDDALDVSRQHLHLGAVLLAHHEVVGRGAGGLTSHDPGNGGLEDLHLGWVLHLSVVADELGQRDEPLDQHPRALHHLDGPGHGYPFGTSMGHFM